MKNLYEDLCDIAADEGMPAALNEAAYRVQECRQTYRMWAATGDRMSDSERKEKENAYIGWQAAERFIRKNHANNKS